MVCVKASQSTLFCNHFEHASVQFLLHIAFIFNIRFAFQWCKSEDTQQS